MNTRARRALVKSLQTLGDSATETERALEEIQEDVSELKAQAATSGQRLTSISTQIKAVSDSVARIEFLLMQQGGGRR